MLLYGDINMKNGFTKKILFEDSKRIKKEKGSPRKVMQLWLKSVMFIYVVQEKDVFK